jgi:hypothetical protein
VLGAVKGLAPLEPSVPQYGRLRLAISQLLMRFDPGPRHYLAALAVLVAVLTGSAYWLGLLPIGGYSQLGFVVQGEVDEARVNATPLAAVSRGEFGVGGLAALPNLVRTSPDDGAQGINLDADLSARFDQPMDRRSVERSLSIEPPLSGRFTWGADNEVRFTPAQPMLLGVTYTVTLTSTARSLHGIQLSEPVHWSFHTRAPYAVAIEPDAGTALSPTSNFTLRFEVPMLHEGVQVALRSTSTSEDIPATLHWDTTGRNLTIAPKGPLPFGDLYVWVGAGSITQEGDKLGKAYESAYTVALPAPRLRLEGSRARAVPSQTKQYFYYEVLANAGGGLPSSLTFDIYALPIERLASWGVQAREREWPAPLPTDAREGLTLIKTIHQPYDVLRTSKGRIEIPSLAPGAYLVMATAPFPQGVLRDWQTLLVSGGSLALVDNHAIWATNADGHAWSGSEILLFGPDGALLKSGQAAENGLWIPEGGPTGATLAIARDPNGGQAATIWEQAIPAPASTSGTLNAAFLTDRDSYRPGQTINFRAQLQLPTPAPASVPPAAGSTPGTPVIGKEIVVSLLHPNGATLATMGLTADDVGGASGSLPLPASAQAGEYSVLMQSGDKYKAFPILVLVEERAADTLSVYIVPASPEEADTRHIIRTVSILGPGGDPVSAAVVTATLGIYGERWTSEPITATTDGAGRATVVLPVPDWVAGEADPALLLSVEAHSSAGSRSQELYGRHTRYLDRRAASLQSGTRHLTSPSLDLSAILSPMEDGSIALELSPLGSGGGTGDVLVVAESRLGTSAYWTLDPTAAAPLLLASEFRGGRILLRRAGREGAREIILPPLHYSNFSLSTASSIQPGAPVSLTLSLTASETGYSAGAAAVRFQRAGGSSLGIESSGWISGIELTSSEAVTTTITAPGEPGLWYIIAEVALVDGKRAQAQHLVRVLPGTGLQIPPLQSARVGVEGRAAIVVHNAGEKALSSGLRVEGGPDLRVLGGGSQAIDVAAGTWKRVEWQYVPQVAGSKQMAFTFMPSAGVGGSWSLGVLAHESDRMNVTYVAGTSTEQRRVGVQVPSGLSPNDLRLEVRASTHLLPALTGIATGPLGGGGKTIEEVARFGSLASVAYAYSRVGAPMPEDLQMDPLLRASLLDTIYSTQRSDGGWSTAAHMTTSSITETASVLLSLKREALAATVRAQQPDSAVISRALAFLTREVQRPVEVTTEALDARAYALYALAQSEMPIEDITRLYVKYATGQSGNSSLSREGQAWLALALHYRGDYTGEGALFQRLLTIEGAASADEAAPMLEILLLADAITKSTPERSTPLAIERGESPDYEERAREYVRLLMNSRRGSGWGSSYDTADAVWALSAYAVHRGEQPATGIPSLVLNGRAVETRPGIVGGMVQIALAGDTLHPGTNWLELRPAVPGQTYYYSLTLRASR